MSGAPDQVIVQTLEGDQVVIEESEDQIVVSEIGVQGPTGPQGNSGPQGPVGPQGPGGAGVNFVWNQNTPASVWVINHNLNAFPSVTVVDSAGTTVIGDVVYVDSNTVTITFSAAFGGQAFLN